MQMADANVWSIDYGVEQYSLGFALYITVYRILFGYILQPFIILD